MFADPFSGGTGSTGDRTLDAGGLPYRSSPSLDTPVIGLIPLDTHLTTIGMQLCLESRNWYLVEYGADEAARRYPVWVVDGVDGTYWLEPVPTCLGETARTTLFPGFVGYSQGLIVDGYDSATDTLRFSAEYFDDAAHTLERHYLNFQVRDGVVTRSDYWYRNLITPELTDRLGITEQVFGAEEDFTGLHVSPDRTRILYQTPNPQIPDCAHGCRTSKLWIADIDGSNSLPLGDYYGRVNRVIWGEEQIRLSITPAEVFSPDLTVTFYLDGHEQEYADEVILGGRSLPFEYVSNLPIESPDGEWISVTMGGEALYEQSGFRSTGFILNQNEDRWIQLPYNGNAASEIVWLDSDTILYPVIGLGWSGADYGLPDYFYAQDGLWEIHLDFDTLTYRLGGRLTNWIPPEVSYGYPNMLDPVQTHYILIESGIPIIYSGISLDMYCISRG